jgi:hypothetical protein
MKRTIRATALSAMILGACLLFPGRTFAATPQIQFIPVSFGHVAPDLSAACGFQVTVWDQGTIKVATYVDNAGNPVRAQLIFQNFKLTFSGNGKSFTSPSPDPNSINLVTGTTSVHGLQLAIIVPGRGVLGIQAGTVVVDANGNVVFQAGQVIADNAAICTALS